MLEEGFVRDLRNLARELEIKVDSFESGHARWHLYSRAIRVSVGIDRLIPLLSCEPDATIAASVALQCLEEVPEPLLASVVNALPAGGSQGLARARMADLSVLDALASRPSEPPGATSMAGWSQWLQLRAAKLSSHRQVLEYLASSGATKRIRREALARARD
ncbi:hypothetical protein L3Q65_23180 [Amycolatopsis sp. FU40]|uniref:hypothetical protein n=1 Tax=Amycolatopsis sp. FU40 TaxID=2914159 RepID=UPI001F3B07C5|nr:hypothetical protein [Amycolatopsis sp. FU40]UKD59501.1 hypothetical protein L3Q65_23180 [Amycolatopsis sp. FU40]